MASLISPSKFNDGSLIVSNTNPILCVFMCFVNMERNRAKPNKNVYRMRGTQRESDTDEKNFGTEIS